MTAASPPGDGPRFTDQERWFANLPGVVLAAGALITDPAGRLLLVKPNYRDYWTLPGGICEHGEPPHAGCAREVTEELGLNLPVGALLAIDWLQPYGEQARPSMHFVFDGGTVSNGDHIVLQSEELDEFGFVAAAEIAAYLAPFGVPRVEAALAARAAGTAIYVPAPG
jgi:8-oxo-dGTP diphosphatase